MVRSPLSVVRRHWLVVRGRTAWLHCTVARTLGLRATDHGRRARDDASDPGFLRRARRGGDRRRGAGGRRQHLVRHGHPRRPGADHAGAARQHPGRLHRAHRPRRAAGRSRRASSSATGPCCTAAASAATRSIGMGALLLSGCEVGEECLIAAGTLDHRRAAHPAALGGHGRARQGGPRGHRRGAAPHPGHLRPATWNWPSATPTAPSRRRGQRSRRRLRWRPVFRRPPAPEWSRCAVEPLRSRRSSLLSSTTGTSSQLAPRLRPAARRLDGRPMSIASETLVQPFPPATPTPRRGRSGVPTSRPSRPRSPPCWSGSVRRPAAARPGELRLADQRRRRPRRPRPAALPGRLLQRRERWLLAATSTRSASSTRSSTAWASSSRNGRGTGAASSCWPTCARAASVACDRPLRRPAGSSADELRLLRRTLTPYEQACLPALGQMVSHALEATCRTLVAGETRARGRRPDQPPPDAPRRPAAPRRRRRRRPLAPYRQFGFTSTPIRKYAVLTATARKYGLCATASRSVCFGPPDETFRAGAQRRLQGRRQLPRLDLARRRAARNPGGGPAHLRPDRLRARMAAGAAGPRHRPGRRSSWP